MPGLPVLAGLAALCFRPTQMLQPGDVIGPYRIDREIGHGGMSIVYLAYHQRLERAVALKMLYERYQNNAAFVERFMFEARAAARLAHPNIVAIHDAGQIDGLDYIAMEYVEGESLADVLRRVPGPLPIDFTLSIASQVAEALDYAHGRGIVHRDIKPSNILVRPNGHALLSDFGIARAASMGDLTQSGTILGTPEYMAPEQAEGRRVDGRSDAYSLAVVVYHALTGQPPFRGETPQAVLYAHVHHPVPDPRAANPALPPMLTAVLRLALGKDPDQRYPTAQAFVMALKVAMQPGASQPPPARRRSWGKDLWLYVAIGFLLGLAGLSLAAWALLRGQQPPPALPPAPSPTSVVAGGDIGATLIPLAPTATPTVTATATSTPTATATPTPAETPTPTPVLPPRIAYVSDRTGSPQIFIINSDGSGDTQLTSAGRNERPFWWPDGSLIFFSSDRSGREALWSMRPDGSEQTELFAAAGATAYSLSPDGQHVSYARIGDEGDYDIYVDGARWFALPGNQVSYLWAPDSSRIVFEHGDGVQVLYSIAVGASTPQQITGSDYGSWNPGWAPDSRRLVFASTRDGNAGIYVAAADGSDTVRLTPLDAWSQVPAWSPDGAVIAHVSGEPNGAWGLYAMRADGSGRVRLHGDVYPETPVAWSADSSQFVFTLFDGDLELVLSSRDGSVSYRLTDNDANDWNPVWEP